MWVERAEVLAAYDRHVRREAAEPLAVVEHLPLVTRIASASHAPYDNGIVWSALDEATVEAAIDEAVAFFDARGASFEWKLYAHDTPVDLAARLERRGFVADVPETIMVISPGAGELPVPEIPGVRVAKLDDPAHLEDLEALRAPLFGDFDSMTAVLGAELAAAPAGLSIYVAYVGEVPIAAGWIRFEPGNPFASLWGGSTLPAHRRRGVYRALVAHRVNEARARGLRYATVDARETSRPILERLGFQRLCGVTGYVWSGSPSASGG